jgi:hypothetical protein
MPPSPPNAPPASKPPTPDPPEGMDSACQDHPPDRDKEVIAKALGAWSSSSVSAAPPVSAVDIYSPYHVTPAGAETIVNVDHSYADVTEGDHIKEKGIKSLNVRAVLQLGREDKPKPEDLLFPAGPIASDKIPSNDEFAKSMSLSEGATRVRFDAPLGLGNGWNPINWPVGRLTLFGCQGDKLAFVGRMDTSYSSGTCSLVATLAAGALLYVFATLGVWRYEKSWRIRKLHWPSYLDPVILASGPDSKGNLSRVQILFFSALVFGLLLFIWFRVGLLSAMSPDVLLLLGVSAVGAAAVKLTERQKERLTFDNWAWLIQRRWLPRSGLQAVTVANWGDLLTGKDGFDVYHFQMLIFSLVVGFGLFKIGLGDLATFTVPQSLLTLLGLTQAIYVAGQIVDQPAIKELDKALEDLRKLESTFLAAVTGKDGAVDLQAAKAAAKEDYERYNAQRVTVIQMLDSIFPHYAPGNHFANGVTNPGLEPGYPEVFSKV